MRKNRKAEAGLTAVLAGCLVMVWASPSPAESNPSASAQRRLWIGATANKPTPTGIDRSLRVFDEANRLIGPLRYRRCFDASLPSTFQQSCARDDWSHGFRSFVSWKPPNRDHAGTAAGRYDTEIKDWARSVPRDIGVYATVWHEPENDISGAQYVAMYQHVYAVVKAANPSITFGPVYMAYWWHEGSNHYAPGGPNAWWVWNRYADFVGVDTYAPNPVPLEDDTAFQGWLHFVNAKAPTKPLVVAEYARYVVPVGGQPDPAKQAARARIIPKDEAYLRSMRFTMWLYWHGTGPKGDWRLTDPASQEAWRKVALNGRSA